MQDSSGSGPLMRGQSNIGQSPEGLTGAVRSATKSAHAHGKLLLVVGGGLSASRHGPPQRQLECPNNMEAHFLQSR